ncbi:MAG TPA: LysR family transcriptional regulator [Verrucomicrobiae bacterium]|jgi:DNA-binding transcriptional LysR family regulator|nr:LysR family transcriptional regulator [Verrucomicrobiae bacterium]
MNRNHLALFHMVARAGSISRGAEQARVSQPAVSKQIAELEEALGVQLLERLPRGCQLTEAGRILADYAGRWRSVETEAARAIEEYRGLKRGKLAIGASMTIGGYLLPGAIGEFHRRFPDIELQMEIANTRRIQESLLDGSIELGLTEGPMEDSELKSLVFFHDELVPIAPVGHPLLKRKNVHARDICREPFILREEGSGTRAVVERALRRKGLKVTPLLSLASSEAIKNAVAAGIGLAIVSRWVIESDLQTRRLGIIPLKDLEIQRPLHLQRIQGRSESPAVSKFLEVLKSQKIYHAGATA